MITCEIFLRMQVGVELGSGGCHIVSSANGESSIISRCRGMFQGNAGQSCCRGMSSGRADGDHRVKECEKSIVSRCRGMFPRYPDVVECFRECRSTLQSWNVSRAGTGGRHRKVTYDESGSPNSYQQHFPLAVMEFFGSPISTSGVAVIRICVVCVL